MNYKKELIVSRYSENVEWLYEVDSSVNSIVLYNKGEELKPFDDKRVKIVKLENVGREAHTYIHHFLKHRENLADTTIVCQGDPFDHSLDFLDRLKVDYDQLTSLTHRYKSDWPLPHVVAKDKISTYKGFEIRMGNMDYFGHRDQKTTRKWFEQTWKKIFENPCPVGYFYGYAATWAIPRDLIRFRTEKFWSHYYGLLSKQFAMEAYILSTDAWAFEALWKAIFTPSYRTIL